MSKIKGLVTSICFYLSGRGSQSDQMGHAAGGGTLWRKNASGFLIQVGRGGDGILQELGFFVLFCLLTLVRYLSQLRAM